MNSRRRLSILATTSLAATMSFTLKPTVVGADTACGTKAAWLGSAASVSFRGPVYQEIDVLKWIGLDFTLTLHSNGKESTVMNTSPGIGENVFGSVAYQIDGRTGVLSFSTRDSYHHTSVTVTMTPDCANASVTRASARIDFDNGNNVPHHFVFVSKDALPKS